MVEEMRNPFPIDPANPIAVEALCRHLAAAFEEYCNRPDSEELPFIDALMGVHNFHKLIVFDVIDRTKEQSPVPAVYSRGLRTMAAQTFTQAMLMEEK